MIHIGVHVPGTLLSGHMKDRGSLARVIDDNVVDVVIVDYVRDVWTSSTLLLSALLLARRWATAAHSKALAIK